jgi:hypothetical protein
MRRAVQHAGRWLWAQRSSSGDVATAASHYALRQCAARPQQAASILPDATGPGRLLSRGASTAAAAAAAAAAPGASQVQIILKAHELRYIQAASAAIRDLLLLNCLPKAAAPPAEHGADGGPPPELWLPIGDAPIPQRLTRYTVLRSPHVDKKSREQFERKVHKRCISAPAVEEHELRWLLDNLKLYEFPGGAPGVAAARRCEAAPAWLRQPSGLGAATGWALPQQGRPGALRPAGWQVRTRQLQAQG